MIEDRVKSKVSITCYWVVAVEWALRNRAHLRVASHFAAQILILIQAPDCSPDQGNKDQRRPEQALLDIGGMGGMFFHNPKLQGENAPEGTRKMWISMLQNIPQPVGDDLRAWSLRPYLAFRGCNLPLRSLAVVSQ